MRPKFIFRMIGGSPGFSALPLSRDSFGLAQHRHACTPLACTHIFTFTYYIFKSEHHL